MGGAQSKASLVPQNQGEQKDAEQQQNQQQQQLVNETVAGSTPQETSSSSPSRLPPPRHDGGGEGGGCPMKLEGGGYRFGGWFGKGGGGGSGDGRNIPKGHPPIFAAPAGEDKINVSTPAAVSKSSSSYQSEMAVRERGVEGSGGGIGCPVMASPAPSSSPSSSSSSFWSWLSPSPPPSADQPGGGGGGAQAGGGGGCPVKSGGSIGPVTAKKVQYNVYSQPIDPNNMMPAVANQLPNPNQKEALSTERKSSTIPKGGADDGTTWKYPSPQMFYNSLARKGKLADSDETVMESVVALHNNMNEKTWAKVLEWEALASSYSWSVDEEGDNKDGPKLLKFMGRPSDLSPKARFKSFVLGHPLPFDRHDWTIVRPDGTEVRYVIDYYHDDTRARVDSDSAIPDMHDRDAVRSILVDVRPALDGPSALFERIAAMPYARHVAGTTRFEPLPMIPTKELKEQVDDSRRTWEAIQEKAREQLSSFEACSSSEAKDEKEEEGGTNATRTTTTRTTTTSMTTSAEKIVKVGTDKDDNAEIKIGKDEAKALASTYASMLRTCLSERSDVDSCELDDDCARASLALTMCMGKVACPLQANAVLTSLEGGDDLDQNDVKAVEEYNARLDKALENVSACVAGISERAAIAKMVHPDAFEGIRSSGSR